MDMVDVRKIVGTLLDAGDFSQRQAMYLVFDIIEHITSSSYDTDGLEKDIKNIYKPLYHMVLSDLVADGYLDEEISKSLNYRNKKIEEIE